MHNTSNIKVNKIKGSIHIRKAKEKDVDGILQIASSVGKEKKDHRQGFLMDDYTKNIEYHKKGLIKNVVELEYFYVAEQENILGFLIAYTKDQWRKENDEWENDIFWHPNFDTSRLDDFILIDKTAIDSQLTGLGIGSKMYEVLFQDAGSKGIKNVFAETLIAPMPNFSSLEFRLKQGYSLCGFRYEEYSKKMLSTLVYYKEI